MPVFLSNNIHFISIVFFKLLLFISIVFFILLLLFIVIVYDHHLVIIIYIIQLIKFHKDNFIECYINLFFVIMAYISYIN